MLYIHIPFCKGKCIYCDFYSGGNPDWSKYLKVVATELRSRIDELRGDSLSSIYIGGGTPSLIPAKDFEDFISEIKTIISGNEIDFSSDMEFTIEVNPEDVCAENIKAWKNAGVNRVSMGIQSLSNSELTLIRRRHTAEKALDSLYKLKQHFNNISIDIIYGIPGQTQQSLHESLEKILLARPAHISAYALTYEPKTLLYYLREKGEIRECPEELYLDFDNLIQQKLEGSGYERYEISNYSLAGMKSRHNRGYWQRKKYVGLGPSASSYDGARIRRTNPANLKAYVNHFSESRSIATPFYEEETLSKTEMMEEEIMVSLRTKEGINLDRFEAEFGKTASEYLIGKSQKWIDSGMLIHADSRLALTREGISISDLIILDLA